MSKLSMMQTVEGMIKLTAEGRPSTLIGIGPMSPNLLQATFELARDCDFPPMFIASRNQVDSDEFGAGYVNGWDQFRFAADIKAAADAAGYEGDYYLCRDHGGPWQRDAERNDKLPTEQAMEIGLQSYLDDAEAGFDLLHIDPTKDPHCTGVVPLSTVLERTITLIEKIEQARKRYGWGELSYEVGTEETMGGLISAEAFEGFIKELKVELEKRSLPMPLFVVGQTGTLTRLTSNVGSYDTPTAKTLSDITEAYGTGLKEHNGDYLSNAILLEHPVIGLAAMNVAPEFGLVETQALLELATIEEKFVEKSKQSGIRAVLARHAVEGQRWRKWMMGEKRTASIESIMQDADDVKLITQMCGHYTLEDAEVKTALARLNENTEALGLSPKTYVVKKIKDAIDRYIYCFGLYGTTSEIIAALEQ